MSSTYCFVKSKWQVCDIEISILIVSKSLQFFVVRDLNHQSITDGLNGEMRQSAYPSPFCLVTPVEETTNTIFAVNKIVVLNETKPAQCKKAMIGTTRTIQRHGAVLTLYRVRYADRASTWH